MPLRQQIASHAHDPSAGVDAIFAAIADDLARPAFRGCPFNNASIEFDDPAALVETARV